MSTLTHIFSNEFKYPRLFIIGLALLAFFPLLGYVHLFDWDEINFAESAREMMITGDYFRVRVNFEPFWEKPPFFFWLQVLSMKVFGINEFAARFPNAVCGIVSLLVLFQIGKKLLNQQFGMIWAILYMGSFLPHFYFKSGIIDPVFNLFIFLGVYFLLLTIEDKGNKEKRNAFFAGLFTGMAILTKGPVGLLLVGLSFLVYWAVNRFRRISSIWNVLLFAATVFMVSFFWFGMETIKNGPWFIVEFISYQIDLFSKGVAGHEQPFYYHFVVVLIGCFPMSVLGLKPLVKNIDGDEVPFRFQEWMRILFWVVLILFSIVTTKIIHYSSMTYFPLSFLAAYYLYGLVKNKQVAPNWLLKTNLVIGVLFGLLMIAVPVLLIKKTWFTAIVKDKFMQMAARADIPMMGWEFMIGLLFIAIVITAYLLFKKAKNIHALAALAGGLVVSLLLLHAFVVPKIEILTQRPPIEFYESLQGKDVYVETVGFKSYAHLFYTRKQPQEDPTLDGPRLLWGPVDKKTYLVTKAHKKEQMNDYDDVIFSHEKGGFAFFYRNPVK